MAEGEDKGKKLRITAFLIKEDCKSIADFLDTDALQKSEINSAGAKGTLYYKSGFAKPPPWSELFTEAAGFDQKKMRNSSCRAVYVVNTADRWFCFTFGYTRHLIQETAIERNFGLKVALNLGDPETIKAIDKVNISHVGLQSREQAGRDVGFQEFEFNTDIDLLKSMTAKAPQTADDEQETYSGRDSVSVYTRIELSSFADLAKRLLKAFESTAYQKRYPWIDKITQERDVSIVQALDAALIAAINKGDTGKIWLAVPELLAWEKLDKFAYAPQSKSPKKASPGLYPDIDLETWLQETGLEGSLTRNHLSQRKIYLRYQDDSPPDTWSVFRCMNAEIDLADRKYILNDGEWYNVDKDFVKEVDSYYKAIPSSTLKLPKYGTDTEPTYLKKVPGACPEFFLMDRKLVKAGLGRSKIEFCDLYSKNRDIIHVKQYGGSSLLSHLFSQAVVSGECFLYMESFRQEVNGYLPIPLQLADCKASPNAGDYTICVAIMSKVPGELELPFFSKVSLRYSTREMLKMGYKVAKLKIER